MAESYTGLTLPSSSSTVWPRWVQASSFTSTSTTAYTDPWQEWNTLYTGTATSITGAGTVWRLWNSDITTAATNNTMTFPAQVFWPEWVRHQDETAEQRKVREAAEAQRRVEAAERDRVYREENERRALVAASAGRRAMELLHSMLTLAQSEMLKKNKFFYVDAASGRRYRIDEGAHANVKTVDKVTGSIIERLCVQPSGIPAGDVMLIQKLLIETHEQAFRDTANITAYDPRGQTTYSKHHLTGDKLGEIIEFPQRAQQAA